MIQKEISVCDPHFHLWDITGRPNPNLGIEVNKRLPAYLSKDYFTDMNGLPKPLKCVSGVHVETIVGQMEGGFRLDPVEETSWVCNQLELRTKPGLFGIVSYMHLTQDISKNEKTLQQHFKASRGRLRGVRMILNHHPKIPDLTWPQVSSGKFMQSNLFRENIALLEENNLSFDLQCNPHQLEDASRVFSDFPKTRVILNHLGLPNDEDKNEQTWRKGMHLLADLPNICVKLSMLWFYQQNFHQDPSKETKVRDLVQEVISLFGCDRCMFASNYPVDKLNNLRIGTLYTRFLDWTVNMPEAACSALFHDTAVRAYNLKIEEEESKNGI